MAYTTIDDPSAYFQTKLYTGTQNSHAITLDGNSDLQPDWVWIKCRDDSHNHQVFDSVRGVHKRMRTDTTGAETTSDQSLKSFDSDGFTLGTEQNVNASASNDNSFVAWNWKAGTSFSNDASATSVGTIDSTGSVSDTAGFSIVSYTGTGSAGTVKHGLSTTPAVVLVKSRGGVYGWGMYHHKNTSAPETDYLSINNSDATVDDAVFWNDTAPTSSVFSLGGTDAINKASTTHIAYCFAEKKGYSKFDSYTGNGNADGAFVYTGFSPSFVLLKETSNANNWMIFDNKRSPFNLMDDFISPDISDVESTGNANNRMDMLSSGFKIRGTGSATNRSGSTFIYMAFASSPFTTSTGISTTAR